MSSRAVGRDRTRRVRGKSRLREAFEETLSENVNQFIEGRGHNQKIITGYNRAIQDINTDVVVINRRHSEEFSDLEKDETKLEADKIRLREEVKSERENIEHRIKSLDDQTQSENRSIHLLAQRGGRIITENVTLPAHEQKGTEIIENEIETRRRRLLELEQQKSELEERKHKLNRELAEGLKNREQQLAAIKERKRRLTAEKERRLAEKETEKIRVTQDTQQQLKAEQ